MEYVLLADDNDATVMVGCPDGKAAERVASAAVWGSGGVSAWRVPTHGVTDIQKVIDTLNDGGDCGDLHDLRLPLSPREPV